MSYGEFCSYANANYSSGPGCGDRGSFFLFNMQRKRGAEVVICGVANRTIHVLVYEYTLDGPIRDIDSTTMLYQSSTANRIARFGTFSNVTSSLDQHPHWSQAYPQSNISKTA
eukprot:COSAG02_NODE_714_length_18094_cov_13.275688_11_plen_113_part_00